MDQYAVCTPEFMRSLRASVSPAFAVLDKIADRSAAEMFVHSVKLKGRTVMEYHRDLLVENFTRPSPLHKFFKDHGNGL